MRPPRMKRDWPVVDIERDGESGVTAASLNRTLSSTSLDEGGRTSELSGPAAKLLAGLGFAFRRRTAGTALMSFAEGVDLGQNRRDAGISLERGGIDFLLQGFLLVL